MEKGTETYMEHTTSHPLVLASSVVCRTPSYRWTVLAFYKLHS